METSVYRISGVSEEDIWEIGQENVAKPSGRTLYARRETTAGVILRTSLALCGGPPNLYARLASCILLNPLLLLYPWAGNSQELVFRPP